ncbi:MAG: 6-hydroxymethylpterin diphosphokinase MptE-like protein [bacterium]
MQWADWAPSDAAIRAEFGYSLDADQAAARALHAIVPATSRFRELGVEVRNRRNVAVIGAGPSLARTTPSILEGKVVVAADGAVTWLREVRVTPHVVVTDLDGNPDDLVWAAQQGAHMVVHAHGDNRDAIRGLASRLLPQLYGTYQGPPMQLEPMRNVGGFTDGDRAVVLCEDLGARQATLVGFDFGAEPSAYSYKWDPKTKPAKLAWAERIVGQVAARGKMRVELYRPA